MKLSVLTNVFWRIFVHRLLSVLIVGYLLVPNVNSGKIPTVQAWQEVSPECKTYTDQVYGFSICYPDRWNIIPANEEPASQTLLLPKHSGVNGTYEAIIEFGVFIFDRDPSTPLEQWSALSSSLRNSFVEQYPTKLNQESVLVQKFDALEWPTIRVYIPRGSKVYFADFGPVGSSLEQDFWKILETFSFIAPYDVTQPIHHHIYTEKPRLEYHITSPQSEPPSDMSLPFAGDTPITQGPGGSYSHHCPGSGYNYTVDCEAIDFYLSNGTRVYAPADGIWVFEQRADAYGNTAYIFHANGTETWLAHLSSTWGYQDGLAIRQGHWVGRSGRGGTGDHLHMMTLTCDPYHRPVTNCTSLPIDWLQGIKWNNPDNKGNGGGMAYGPPALFWDTKDATSASEVSYLFARGFENLDTIPLGQDTARFLRIGKGWIALLYKDLNYTGSVRQFDYSGELGDFSGQVSSIKVNYSACPVLQTESQFRPFYAPPMCVPPPTFVNDDVAFISHVTYPENSVVPPNQLLIKTWRVRNTGVTSWGGGYQLAFVGGEQMNAPSAVDIPATPPGQEVDLSIALTAPETGGEYAGYWQLRNPQGTYFGPRLWAQINVQGAGAHIPVFTADPPSPADTDRVHVYARVEGLPNFRAIRLLVDGESKGETSVLKLDYDWNWDTSGYAAGDHSLVVEVADQTDTSWSRPERRSLIYTLQGTAGSVNHAPQRPNPASPYDWYVYYSGNTATLCAQANGDPDGDAITGYYFDVFESAELWNSGWVGDNCVTTSALGPYNYQWRVKVRDAGGAESDWSDAWHFTLVNPSLSITELYCQPLDGNSEQVRIRACTAGQGGVGITMRVKVNDASDGSENGEWRTIKELGVYCFNETDAPVWNTLDYGDGPHLVRVEAHGADASWNGAAARQTTCTLPHRRPDSTALLSPVPPSRDIREAIYLNTRTLTFRWAPTLRASSYTLHIGTTPSPRESAAPVFRQEFDSSVTEHTITLDQDYPTLYWQVSTTNDAGNNASGDQLFGIDATSPTCAVQPLPGVVYESVFQVSWTGTDDLSGVRAFDIQYRDSGRDDWQDWLNDSPAAPPYALFTGKPGHTYAFRCRAADNAFNTGDYPENADTVVTVDPTARPPAPWWNEAYTLKRYITLLNGMPAVAVPVGYPVHLHFDGGTSPTAAELYAASQSTPRCDDLRVVVNDTTELDRVVQTCSDSAIDLWFRAQASIPGGASDGTTHQLYYGNPAPGAPPGNPNQVWYPYAEGDTAYLYFFQEGSGATAYDASGNARDCSIDSSVEWGEAKFGHGLRFNRPYGGDRLSLTCGAAVLSAFTIEFWFNPDLDGDGRIAGQIKGGVGLNWLLQSFEGRIRLDVWPCTTCGSAEVRSNFYLRDAQYAGKWNHIAVTFNGGNEVKFYINGALDSTKYFPSSGLTQHNIPLEIGSVEGGTQIKASLGAFRISNGVKTDFPYGAFAAITSEPTLAAGDPVARPISGAADLALLSVDSYPSPAGGLLVQAVVQNQGNLDTRNGFYTDLYVDHLPTGGDTTHSLRFWVNEPIAAGALLTLTTTLTDITPAGNARHSALAPGAEVTGTLYTQADSGSAIIEPDDQNNISAGTEICLAAADAYEGDDTTATATPFVLDVAQDHNFDKLSDQDWFRFEAQAGITYTIATFDLGGGADTYLYLYDTDGATLLAANDDYSDSLASFLEWRAPLAGTYYVQAQHWNPNVGGCGTRYALVLHEKQSPPQPTRVYLPMILRAYIPGVTPTTLTVYSSPSDGEIMALECASWAECRDATQGSMSADYPQATIAATYFSGTYTIKRVFLYFDTSAVPASATIQAATLHFYAGPYLNGPDQRVHVVQSYQNDPLSDTDFGALTFTSGGFADLAAETWMEIPLNAGGQAWVVPDGVTRLALIHNLDLTNSAPTDDNNAVVSLTEDGEHRPYLTVEYVTP